MALRILSAAGTVVVLVAAAVSPAAATVSATGGSAAAVKRTSLTLRVRGCDGCTIQPVKAGGGSRPAHWRGKDKLVRDGVVHWKVAQRRTVGMSFDISDPNQVFTDFMADIVVAYPGISIGARVPARVARHKRRANACWAGTRRSSVTLRVKVEHFPAVSAFPPVVHGYAIRPYLVRTRPFLRLFDGKGGTYSQASHGVTGNQDAYFCAGSPVRRRGG